MAEGAGKPAIPVANAVPLPGEPQVATGFPRAVAGVFIRGGEQVRVGPLKRGTGGADAWP